MTKKNQTLFESYAEKKAEMAKLQEELDAMESKVLAVMEWDTLPFEYGTFSKVYRKAWKYTSDYDFKKEEYDTILKQMREDEQRSGEAKFEEKVGLSFRKYEAKK